MILVFDQGATERRTLDIDGTEDLTGATARLVAVANGKSVLDLTLPVIASTRQTEIVVPPATSSAWTLTAWGPATVTATESGYTGKGKRADFQIEVTLADGTIKRLDLGTESFFVVTPELVK